MSKNFVAPAWFIKLYEGFTLTEIDAKWQKWQVMPPGDLEAIPDPWPNIPVDAKVVNKEPEDEGILHYQEATNPKDLLGIRKSPLHLVPSALSIWVSQIFKMSAVKYGPFNWRDKKVKKSIYLDAIERHLIALKEGQDFDPESGRPHEAHIAANCAILLDAKAVGNLTNDMVWKSGPGPDLLKQVEDKI